MCFTELIQDRKVCGDSRLPPLTNKAIVQEYVSSRPSRANVEQWAEFGETAGTNRVAFFFGLLALGGIARNRVHLAEALAQRGVTADLVAMRVKPVGREMVPDGIRIIDLDARRVRRGLPKLIDYLTTEKPSLLVASEEIPSVLACLARRWTGLPERLVLSVHNTQSRDIAARSDWIDRKLVPRLMRRFYRWADDYIAVSDQAADDLSRLVNIPRSEIKVVPNPVVTPHLVRQAQQPVQHPWLTAKDRPVLVTAARLAPQKDLPTLLRAFARLVAHRPAYLIILGRGPRAEELKAQARTLGIANLVDFHGFVNNPFPYFAAADGFVLSSAWEGLPGVVIQAMACGCPIVATDCPGGTADILEGGRFGRLVPVGDHAALAKAMNDMLDDPCDPLSLVSRAMDFHVDRVIDRYTDILCS
jgi:glycosyltransferase involved in cell wall biosynthesis